jgi:hypothetical protein
MSRSAPSNNPTKTKAKAARKQKDAPNIPSYETLNKLSQEKVTAWFRATSTSDSYKRYVKEGKEWVKKWATEIDGSGSDEAVGETWTDSDITAAFDIIGEATPKALHAFVVYKCEVLDNSYKTAEAIRSAFKHYFT